MATASTHTPSDKMVRVFWTNHGYYSAVEFTSLVDAVKYAKGKGFEAAFHQGSEVLAAWGPISGVKTFAAASPLAASILRSM